MVQVDYLKATLGLTVAQHWFDSWLNSRQLLKLDWKTIPSHLGPYFTLLDKVAAVPASTSTKTEDAAEPKAKDMTSNFLAAQAYLKDKLRFGQLTSLVDLAETTLIYSTVASTTLLGRGKALSGLKLLWDFAGTLPRVNRYGEIVHSLAFVVVLSLVGQVTAVPASLYRTFVLEEKHGFNKTTVQTWILDFIKSNVLSAVLGLPLIAALLKIIQWSGPAFVSYAMAMVIGLQLILIPAYPYLIAPIFNKFRALKEFTDKPNYVEVGRRTEALAKRLNFPLGKLWVIDGSTRSSHSNAYFSGLPFLSKHVVLYDTLLDSSTPEEVEAVLAHELGHWQKNHVAKMMLMSQVILLANLSLIRLSIFNPALYRAFSFTSERPLIIGLMVSMSLLSPLDTITSFIVHAVSRRFEFQADKFAFDLSNDEHEYADNLKSALIRLGNENKSVTDVDGLWSAYKHSHPTMPERIVRLDELITAESKKQ